MTRSLLQPIRTRRVLNGHSHSSGLGDDNTSLTPATRKTLAAIGALWVSFAVTASSNGTGRDAAPGALACVGDRTR